MEEFNRDFKGVWIPKEVYLSKELSWTEKILLVEIDSLDNEDGCYSRNDYFASFLGVSESHVSRMVSKLKKLGLISVESFDGRTRVLHSNLSANPALNAISEPNDMQKCQSSIDNNVKADYAKMSRQTTQKCQSRVCKNADHNNISNNIFNNIENKVSTQPKSERKNSKQQDKFFGHNFSDELKHAITEWLTYKSERRESYKPTGLKMLLTEIEHKTATYEEQDIIDVIYQSMASNWKGICWDKLKGKEKHVKPQDKPIPQDILEAKQRHDEAMKKFMSGKCDWKDLIPE